MPTINLKSLRGELSWTQKDLADALGLTRRQVQRLEAGSDANGPTERLLSAFSADWELAQDFLRYTSRAPELGRECIAAAVEALADGEELKLLLPLRAHYDYLRSELELDNLDDWPWVVELFEEAWLEAKDET